MNNRAAASSLKDKKRILTAFFSIETALPSLYRHTSGDVGISTADRVTHYYYYTLYRDKEKRRPTEDETFNNFRLRLYLLSCRLISPICMRTIQVDKKHFQWWHEKQKKKIYK